MPSKKQVKADRVKDRKVKKQKREDQLNKWAHGDAKSNVGEYRT